jgi:hypothetical protein
LTLRNVRKITQTGLYNQTPTYHTNTAFSADGDFSIFASARNGGSALFRCHLPTGDITQLTELIPGVGTRDELHKGSGHMHRQRHGRDHAHLHRAQERLGRLRRRSLLQAVNMETFKNAR